MSITSRLQYSPEGMKMRHGSWPRARMGVRGSGPHHWNALEALPMRLVLLTPPHRRCAIPVLRPPHAVDSLTPVHRLSGHGRSSIHPALGEQRPGHTGVLVRQSYDDQHGRLAGEHAGQPRAGRHTLALSPANHAAGRDDEKAPESSLAPAGGMPEPLLPASRPLDRREADPDRKVSAGGASASMAVAINGPIPGTVMRRRATSSVLALAAISRSSSAISSCRRRSISTSRIRQERAASGMPEAGSST